MKRCANAEEEGATRKRGCATEEEEMLVVRPSDVPEYLRDSEFYRSLNIEGDEEFHIVANLMKPNMQVETLKDACDLLHTVRFWGLDVPLSRIIHFDLTQPFIVFESELRPFENEFPLMRSLLYALDEQNPLCDRMEHAMEVGSIQLVRHLDTCGAPCTMHALAIAAGSGHVICLEQALALSKHLNLFDASIFTK